MKDQTKIELIKEQTFNGRIYYHIYVNDFPKECFVVQTEGDIKNVLALYERYKEELKNLNYYPKTEIIREDYI